MKKDKFEDEQLIEYSDKYYDSSYEYRQVMFPKKMGKALRDKGLLTEEE